MKVLLAEDDRYFAQLICEYLSDNGFETTAVRTTQDALTVSLDEYGAAVVDVMLPNDAMASGISGEEARGGYLSGVALARKFRNLQPAFPIILISGAVAGGEAQQWARDNGVPFVFKHEGRDRLLSAFADLGVVDHVDRPRSFIVHGHDEVVLRELKDYIQNTLGWPEPVVLREQPNAGRTLIEKFEEVAGLIDWVFVLLTPDDQGFQAHVNDDKRRARQNVVFELGFFYGLIGRREGRVLVLKKGEVELPSDIHGLAWIDIRNGIRASGEDIRKEVGVR